VPEPSGADAATLLAKPYCPRIAPLKNFSNGIPEQFSIVDYKAIWQYGRLAVWQAER